MEGFFSFRNFTEAVSFHERLRYNKGAEVSACIRRMPDTCVFVLIPCNGFGKITAILKRDLPVRGIPPQSRNHSDVDFLPGTLSPFSFPVLRQKGLQRVGFKCVGMRCLYMRQHRHPYRYALNKCKRPRSVNLSAT